MAAAAIAGLAVLSAQSLTLAATGPAGLESIDDASLVAAANLQAVASMGGAELLLLLLLACVDRVAPAQFAATRRAVNGRATPSAMA